MAYTGTVDLTGCGALLGKVPFNAVKDNYILSQIVDLTGGAITQAAVIQSLAIPANTLVRGVHTQIIIPAVGTTLTMDVGDGGSPAGWIGSTNGKATALTFDHSTVGTDARAVAADSGYFYGTADSIDVAMTTATAITAGPKYAIFAECIDLNI
jgi:hypothetical protein